jgi:flagellar hook-associated protein 1 FlgK
MPSLLSIATSGLNAAYAGLQTTSHNISNVNTPGFSRQQTIQTTPLPQYTGGGFLGRGVDVESVQRLYSAFLTDQAHSATATAGEMDTRATQLKSLDSIFGASDQGVSAALNNFYSALDAATANPGDLASRQAALSSAYALAANFNRTASRIEDMRHGAEVQIASTLSVINQAAQDIARLNDSITFAQATGQTPNDLLDKRDNLIRDLNNQLGVSIVKQSNGSYDLFTGNGQPLVLGSTAYTLVSAPDPFDPQHIAIGFQTGTGLMQLNASILNGGKLAGLMKFMEQDLSSAEDGLGRLAATLADAYNTQHKLGVDLNGVTGGNLFNTPAPAVYGNTGNTGTATLSAAISNASALVASAYRVDFAGGNYVVTRLSDNTQQTFATLPQVVDGVTFSVSGAPAANDSFMVQPVRQSAYNISVVPTDPRKLALASPVASSTPQTNMGSVAASSLSVNGPVANANLTQTVTLTFTGPGTFNVTGTGTGNPSGVAYTPGTPVTYNGWTLNLTGTPVAGDTLTVAINTGISGDNRNGLALGALHNAAVANGNTLTEVMAGLFTQVGSNAAGMAAASDAQGQILNQAHAAEQSVSGVNLDEEATNLMKYQHAYQAAAKVIATSQTLFDTLLSLGNR